MENVGGLLGGGGAKGMLPPPPPLPTPMLERLGYGAESRRKVVSSCLGFAMQRLETLSVNQAVIGYLFRIGEG